MSDRDDDSKGHITVRAGILRLAELVGHEPVLPEHSRECTRLMDQLVVCWLAHLPDRILLEGNSEELMTLMKHLVVELEKAKARFSNPHDKN